MNPRRWLPAVCVVLCAVAVWGNGGATAPTTQPDRSADPKALDALLAEPVSEQQARARELAEPYAYLGEERILDYFVHLLPEPGGDMMVIERIAIVCRGDKVKRGIYLGMANKDRYEVIDVRRNGQPTYWWVKDEEDEGPRLSILQEDLYLPQGMYLYTIRYRVKKAVSQTDETRKFRWKPMGPWNMPIDHAALMVQMSNDRIDQTIDGWAYVVRPERRQQVLRAERLPGGPLWFEISEPMPERASMHVFLEWWHRGRGE